MLLFYYLSNLMNVCVYMTSAWHATIFCLCILLLSFCACWVVDLGFSGSHYSHLILANNNFKHYSWCVQSTTWMKFWKSIFSYTVMMLLLLSPLKWWKSLVILIITSHMQPKICGKWWVKLSPKLVDFWIYNKLKY